MTGQKETKFHQSKKVKICYIIGTLEVGGAERQLYLLIKNLNKEKFEPFLISFRGGRMKGKFEKITRVYFADKRFKLDFFLIFRLIKIIRKERPHILHTFMFTSNTWGRIAGIICRIPVIIASERSADLWKKWYHIMIDRFLFNFTDRIVCNSEEIKKIYLERLKGNENKFVVIYNGLEIERYEGLFENEEIKKGFGIKEEKIVITGGRLSFEKNLETFLFAAKKVKDRYERVKFLIIGEGREKDKLLKMTKELNLENDVIFTGYREDLPELIKISEIVVLTSLWEGMPNLILEGMICKKPVICTKFGGAKEIIKDGENGFLVEPKNVEDIAHKILFLLKNGETARDMGEKGYKFVKERFSLEKMVESYEKLYENL